MKKLIILVGIPGSGKSTYCERFKDPLVCSADHYFTKDGVYEFKFEELGNAHSYCQKKFFKWLTNIEDGNKQMAIIDNTNLRDRERAYYIEEALKMKIPTEIHVLPHDAQISKARNVHNVPPDKIDAMIKRLDISPGVYKILSRYDYLKISEISRKDVGMD